MTEQLRCLAISEVYSVPPRGGHVVWLHEVCRRVTRTKVLTRATPGLPSEQTVDGVEIVRRPVLHSARFRPESPALSAGYIVAAAVEGARTRPHALVAARPFPEGGIAVALGMLFGIPSVVFAHGEQLSRSLMRRRARRPVKTVFKDTALWWSCRMARLVVANSHNTAGLLARGGVPAERTKVVHPGTDPKRFRPMARDVALAKRFEIPPGAKVLLTLGRLTPRKGQDMTIRAMPTVLRRFPETVYLVAGVGEYEQSLRNLVRAERVEHRVRFLGSVAPKDIPSLYNLADVFVMPNRQTRPLGNIEGFGIVFLEAGACEKPVVAGRSGGVPEAVIERETGLLVNGESSDEVGRAVIELLAEPGKARSMGCAARERIQRTLTWEHSASRIRSLLQAMVAGSQVA